MSFQPVNMKTPPSTPPPSPRKDKKSALTTIAENELKVKKSNKKFSARIISEIRAVFAHLFCCCFGSNKPTDIERGRPSDKSESISSSSRSSSSSESEWDKKLEVKKVYDKKTKWKEAALNRSWEWNAPLKRLKIQFADDGEKKYSKFNVTIRHEDLLLSQRKAVVNAANPELERGGGIDGTMHDLGIGYGKLHARLKTHYDKQGGFKEGWAVIIPETVKFQGVKSEDKLVGKEDDTPKDQIYSCKKRVIVVAGPQGKQTRQGNAELFSCYRNSLELAHEAGLVSIGFASISTGIYNYPQKAAALVALRAIEEFIKAHPDSQLKTISIHFYPEKDEEKMEANLKHYRAAAETKIKEG